MSQRKPDTLLPHAIRGEWEWWGFVGNTDQDLWVHLQLHLAVHKSFSTKFVKSCSTPHDEELNKQNWLSYLNQPHTQQYFSMAESARYKRILPGLLIGYPKQKKNCSWLYSKSYIGHVFSVDTPGYWPRFFIDLEFVLVHEKR